MQLFKTNPMYCNVSTAIKMLALNQHANLVARSMRAARPKQHLPRMLLVCGHETGG
jgi:hypothetical protein